MLRESVARVHQRSKWSLRKFVHWRPIYNNYPADLQTRPEEGERKKFKEGKEEQEEVEGEGKGKELTVSWLDQLQLVS